MELRGKVGLITGGGSGIGLATAVALAEEGCQAIIVGRDEQKLQAAASEYTGNPSIVGRRCDVTERGQVQELFDWLGREFGPPEVLVNSAGINVSRRAMSELDPADWDRMVAINATGAFNCMHAALPGMRKRRSGLIVNISSIAGKRASALGGPGYCASKFAMTGLGTAVGLEERPNGIRISNIYPGEVATPILKHRPTPVPPERLDEMLQPQDIAMMVIAVAKLPDRAVVPEMVITPLYQEYA